MAQKEMRKVTCDNCDATVMIKPSLNPPEWGTLKVRRDGKWKTKDFCPSCIDTIENVFAKAVVADNNEAVDVPPVYAGLPNTFTQPLLQEAIASTALDRDPRAQTFSVE